MDIKKAEIHRIICEAVEELKRLRTIWKEEFRDVPPVLWFGDIESSKPKVLVISANPNRPDQPESKPRIPYSNDWKKGGRDIAKLEEDYNRYFFNNPSTKWFGKNNVQEGQGRIEDFLNGMDASFYGTKKYQAIHIDLIPFSTTTTFTQIDNQIMAINGLPEWVDKHVKKLVALIDPKVIIINGNSNFDFFNLCFKNLKNIFFIIRLFFSTPVLPGSGSKGMISASAPPVPPDSAA